MGLSEEKSSIEPIQVTEPFNFLGIEFNNGFIRPSKKATNRLLTTIEQTLDQSAQAFEAVAGGNKFQKSQSLVSTLRRVDGMLQGWGKHYRFCNDKEQFANLEKAVRKLLARYMGRFKAAKARAATEDDLVLFGIERLSAIDLTPFAWPKMARAAAST